MDQTSSTYQEAERRALKLYNAFMAVPQYVYEYEGNLYVDPFNLPARDPLCGANLYRLVSEDFEREARPEVAVKYNNAVIDVLLHLFGHPFYANTPSIDLLFRAVPFLSVPETDRLRTLLLRASRFARTHR